MADQGKAEVPWPDMARVCDEARALQHTLARLSGLCNNLSGNVEPLYVAHMGKSIKGYLRRITNDAFMLAGLAAGVLKEGPPEVVTDGESA